MDILVILLIIIGLIGVVIFIFPDSISFITNMIPSFKKNTFDFEMVKSWFMWIPGMSTIMGWFGMNKFTIEGSKYIFLKTAELGKRVNDTANAMSNKLLEILNESKKNIDTANSIAIKNSNGAIKTLPTIDFNSDLIEKSIIDVTTNVLDKAAQEVQWNDQEAFIVNNLIPMIHQMVQKNLKTTYGPGLENELTRVSKVYADNMEAFHKLLVAGYEGVYRITGLQSDIDSQLMDFHLRDGISDNAGFEVSQIHDYIKPSKLNLANSAGPSLIKDLAGMETKNYFDGSITPDALKPKDLDGQLVDLEVANLINNMRNPVSQPFVNKRKILDPRGISDGVIDTITQNYEGKNPNGVEFPVQGTGIDIVNSGLGFGNEDKIESILDSYAKQKNGKEDNLIFDWENILGANANRSVVPNVSGPDSLTASILADMGVKQ